MNKANVTLTWRGGAWRAAMVPAINQGLFAAAVVMANQASRNMGTQGGGVLGSGARIDPKTGERKGPLTRWYRGKPRWISAPPGAFPGMRLGTLKRSIMAVHPSALGTPGHAAFGTALPYGRYLEFGTRPRANGHPGMARRPWIVRSALMARAKASAAFVRTAKAQLKARGLSH